MNTTNTNQTTTSRLSADNIKPAEKSNNVQHPQAIQLARETLLSLQSYHLKARFAGWLTLAPIFHPIKWRDMVSQQIEHEREQMKRIIRMLNNLP